MATLICRAEHESGADIIFTIHCYFGVESKLSKLDIKDQLIEFCDKIHNNEEVKETIERAFELLKTLKGDKKKELENIIREIYIYGIDCYGAVWYVPIDYFEIEVYDYVGDIKLSLEEEEKLIEIIENNIHKNLGNKRVAIGEFEGIVDNVFYNLREKGLFTKYYPLLSNDGQIIDGCDDFDSSVEELEKFVRKYYR